MSIPSPCGLAITSVTSDNNYLYALQPDRKTVYKLDVCGRIICVFKLTRRFSGIHYCGGRFYAVSNSGSPIYILNKCFSEIGSFSTELPADNNCALLCGSNAVRGGLFIGPSGTCVDTDCILTVATCTALYIITPSGRIISRSGFAGNRLYYTAVAENNGILYEGLESRTSEQNFVRATLISTGQSKLQRLPYGYRVRSFFCYGGRFYAFITKNSYHAYVAAVCTYIYDDMLGGEIIALPDTSASDSCCEESCNFGKHSKCTCGSTCASCSQCSGISSNQTEMCDNAVSGESTDTTDCDITELCRIFNCIKKLCGNVGGCNSCGNCNCNNTAGCTSCGNTTGACCPNGTLNCTCFPQCDCDDSDIGGIGCLPLPPCPPTCIPCPPCETCAESACVKGCDGNLKLSVKNTNNAD